MELGQKALFMKHKTREFRQHQKSGLQKSERNYMTLEGGGWVGLETPGRLNVT